MLRRAWIVCALAALATPAAASAQAPLTVYSSLPLQGDSRPQSADVVRAMRLALQQRGGMAGGHPITFRSLDDATPRAGKWEPGKVSQNARRAASDASTIAYLGEFNSGASAVSIPILNEAGIAQISPSNTYAGLTRRAEPGEPDKYYPSGERTFARVIPADHVQAAAVVAYMQAEGVKSVVIASDREAYGHGLALDVRAIARRAGLRVDGVYGIPVRGGRTVQRAIARRARRAGALFYGGITQNDAVGLFRTVGRGAPRAKLFAGDGVAELPFTSRLPSSVQRRTYITSATLDPKEYPALGQQFFAAFRAAYHRDPEPYAIYGYEAMSLALDAIDRSGGTSRKAVVDALFATRDRDSVLGRYSIDANGDTTLGTYGGLRVRGGKLVYARTITASR